MAWPQPFCRRLLAEHFQVTVDELGFHRPRPSATELQRRTRSNPEDLVTLVSPPGRLDAWVEKEQEQWREHRRAFSVRWRALVVLAEGLYPDPELSRPA